MAALIVLPVVLKLMMKPVERLEAVEKSVGGVVNLRASRERMRMSCVSLHQVSDDVRPPHVPPERPGRALGAPLDGTK